VSKRCNHARNRGWRSDREPRQLDRSRNRGEQSDREPRQSDRPLDRGWRLDHHPGRSDCQDLRHSFVAYFTDFGCVPRSALDSTRATRSPDVYNYGRTSRGSGAQPVPLFTSPSGCAKATDTASISAVTADKGRNGDTSGQSSSDDHAGEAWFPASGRQTHPVDHLGVNLVTGTLLPPRHPCRSELAPRHVR
jgi:hypothetical protein